MSAGLRPADVFIASHGRSGSTLLSALLTIPPTHVVLNEPGLGTGHVGTHVPEELRAAGLTPPEALLEIAGGPPAGSTERASQRAAACIGPAVEPCLRWGLKEVNPVWIREASAVVRPRRTIVLVRDLEESAASYFTKNVREGEPHTVDWLIERIVNSLAALASLIDTVPATDLRVVWYHRLVSSEHERAALGEWLDWPLDGEPGRGFERFKREGESRKHAGRIGTASIGNYTRGVDVSVDRFVDLVSDATSDLTPRTHATRPE